MIKSYCDICGEEVATLNDFELPNIVEHVHDIKNRNGLIYERRYTTDVEKLPYGICMKCAKDIGTTIKCLKYAYQNKCFENDKREIHIIYKRDDCWET